MPEESFVLAAQLSTGHSPPGELNTSRVAHRIRESLAVAPIDMLILGWVELPDLFQSLTSEGSRLTNQVFLWYPLLIWELRARVGAISWNRVECQKLSGSHAPITEPLNGLRFSS